MSNANVFIISLHADPMSASGVGEGGGTHAYLRELIVGLSSRKRHFTVVTRHGNLSLPSRQQVSRYGDLVRVPIGPAGPCDKRILNDFHVETLELIRSVLRKVSRPPDVLHSVYWNSGRVAMDLSRETGRPFVHTVISNALRRRIGGAGKEAAHRLEVERDIFANAFRIISISYSEKGDLIALYGVDPSRIVVVGRPVDLAYRRPAHDQLGNPRDVRLDCCYPEDLI